jgi:magnesium transporter
MREAASPGGGVSSVAAPAQTCLVREPSGAVRELPAAELHRISELLDEPGTFVWLALVAPSDAELRLLAEEFGVHPVAMDDVRRRGQRPKLDGYGDQHMLVVYEAAGESVAELHLFGGPDWLVTVQWQSSPGIAAARRQLLRPSSSPFRGTGTALHAVLDAVVDSYFPVLDTLAERIDVLEDRVLEGDGGSEGLRELLTIKRQLLELRRMLGPMREVANALLRREVPFIDERVDPYLRDVYDHLVRLLDQVDLYRDLLATVFDARLTVTSNALNAIMKRLTAITVILMAPTLIAGIYGMNFDAMPELGWPLGYPFALALMAVTMLTAYAFFRRRDWF